jgi:shikimate 5-dehydrogenase
LLRAAAAQGRTVISGKVMFMAQAARQFEIWTGQPAPAGVYESL